MRNAQAARTARASGAPPTIVGGLGAVEFTAPEKDADGKYINEVVEVYKTEQKVGGMVIVGAEKENKELEELMDRRRMLMGED